VTNRSLDRRNLHALSEDSTKRFLRRPRFESNGVERQEAGRLPADAPAFHGAGKPPLFDSDIFYILIIYSVLNIFHQSLPAFESFCPAKVK
jgi:hypothetical protein